MNKRHQFYDIFNSLNSLFSAAFLIPDSSSGESGLRPMRSNLHTCTNTAFREMQQIQLKYYKLAIRELIVVSGGKQWHLVFMPKGCFFRHANSPCGHHGLHVESDGDWGPAGWGWKREK